MTYFILVTKIVICKNYIQMIVIIVILLMYINIVITLRLTGSPRHTTIHYKYNFGCQLGYQAMKDITR